MWENHGMGCSDPAPPFWKHKMAVLINTKPAVTINKQLYYCFRHEFISIVVELVQVVLGLVGVLVYWPPSSAIEY